MRKRLSNKIFLIITLCCFFIAPTFADTLTLKDGVSHPYPAPPIEGIAAWINSNPLTLKDLRGKVVLLDFWTYSCINCVRTIPYINEWYKKYHDKGLVIIGIHSPEFPFEHNVDNVTAAVKRFQIQYPVALDNDYVTWNNYHNQFWPAHYLINQQGDVVYIHYGEGGYDTTENNIRALLGEAPLTNMPKILSPVAFNQTPETYLGSARAERFSASAVNLPLDHWTLTGAWKQHSDNIIAEKAGSSIQLHFYAKKVFLVLGTQQHETIPVTILLNNKPLDKLMVNQDKLYTLASIPIPQEGIIEIIAEKPGLEAYAFTFGG